LDDLDQFFERILNELDHTNLATNMP
jgi:hypothetical protein